jgi:hypothetical protein
MERSFGQTASTVFRTLGPACQKPAPISMTRMATDPRRPIQTKYRTALKAVAGLDPEDESACSALFGLLGLRNGPRVETDGMLSSSGHSLYLAKASDLDHLIARLEAVRLEVASLCTK